MTTTERLRELEKAATAVYERATKLEYDTGDGRAGDVRVWDKNTVGRCVAVFRGENAQPTADAYIAQRNALPAMLAVIEAAEGLKNPCRAISIEAALPIEMTPDERECLMQWLQKAYNSGRADAYKEVESALAAFREVRTCQPQKLGYLAAHYDAEARRKRGEKQVYCCERREWIWADEVCVDKRCRLLTEDAYKRMVKEAKGLK